MQAMSSSAQVRATFKHLTHWRILIAAFKTIKGLSATFIWKLVFFQNLTYFNDVLRQLLSCVWCFLVSRQNANIVMLLIDPSSISIVADSKESMSWDSTYILHFEHLRKRKSKVWGLWMWIVMMTISIQNVDERNDVSGSQH